MESTGLLDGTQTVVFDTTNVIVVAIIILMACLAFAAAKKYLF